MLCERMKNSLESSPADFAALVRNVDRIEFETPEIMIFLIECEACGGRVHSVEMSFDEAAAMDDLLVAQTVGEVRAALKKAA